MPVEGRLGRTGKGEVRKLGMIGGTSWLSTALYYEQINKGGGKKLGGPASAPLGIERLKLGGVGPLQLAGEWGRGAQDLTGGAGGAAGAQGQGPLISSQ